MRSAVMLMAAVVVVVGCSSNNNAHGTLTGSVTSTAPSASVTTEERTFLSVMHPQFGTKIDAQLLTVARSMCRDFGNGAEFSKEVDAVINAGFTATQAGTLIGGAVSALCPQYAAVLPTH